MPSEWENNSSSSSAKVSSSSGSSLSASSSTATSPEPNLNGNNNNNDSAKNGHEKDCALKASTMSHDPTPYVARARVTRPTPPKPSCNPMQFVQIKPCNLYQSAQQQLKKVEEIKKVKEVLKEEPEDWQNNLDNWKSSRRKRVEHIIERVVEVKKLELEEHDRTRRKSKTFSEMMEERGERGRARPKLQSLASYNEDEANDLSDLGIGTSSASGKSSISEDCEVHSIVSEPPEVEHLSSFNINEKNSCRPCQDNHSLDRLALLGGYESSSSTAPNKSPDPYEYTYEGAIEDYKSRVSKASAASSYKKPNFDRKPVNLNDYDNDTESCMVTVKKEDLPKIDISKKRELFENQEVTKMISMHNHEQQIEKKPVPSEFANVRSIKDRLCSLEKKPAPESSAEHPAVTTEILPGEIYSIKERLQCLNQHNSVNPKPNINKVVAEVVAVPPLKDRLSSLQNAVTKEEIVKKPVVLVDEYQLEMLKNEDMARRQLDAASKDDSIIVEKAPSDDSGINTTDEKIDHEPATTEDEDEDEEEELVTVAMTAPIPSKHEDKLNNLNTPTVVSLVDKPVIVNDDHDVGGGDGGGIGVGKTLFNSSKVVVSRPKSDDSDDVNNCEVNHAQNLLKMFKLAFNEESDVIEESVKSNQVEIELDALDSSVKGKKGEGNIQKLVKTSMESSTRSGQDKVKGLTSADRISKERLQASVEAKRKFLGLETKAREVENPKFQFVPKSTESVILNIDNSQKKSSNTTCPSGDNPPSSETSVSSKIQHLNTLCSDTAKNFSKSDCKTQQQLNPFLPSSEKSQVSVSSKIQQLKCFPSDSAKSPLTTDNSRMAEYFENTINCKTQQEEDDRSQTSVAEKIQHLNTISSETSKYPNSSSQKFQTEVFADSKSPQQINSSAAISLIAQPSSHEGSQSPPKCVNVSEKIQHLNNLSAVSQKSNQTFDRSQGPATGVNSKTQHSLSPSSPKFLRTPSPSCDKSQNQPIYENINISYSNPCVGLKKVQSPQNNGRVEIFNSKSMPAKSKSPEVLPRSVKTQQPNDFQRSASNDFINELQTTYEPKIVGEMVKNENVSSQIIKEDLSNSRITSPTSKEHFTVHNSEKDELSPLETKPIPLPRNLNKNNSEPTSLLPFDSCVDILQSFLAAERSSNFSPNESAILKTPNELSPHYSDNFIRQESIIEVPCSKMDVKDLPDPNFIRTPCINVDCNEKIARESIKPAQALLRDSISSAGDSSPSSEITVIFNSASESSKPNQSSLIENANRMGSPIAAMRDPLAQQNLVCEKPCLKIDVKDLPDSIFIKTECCEVDKTTCGSNTPLTPSTPLMALHRTNAEVLKKTCDKLSTSPPLSPVLGGRNLDKPNFLIARVEVVETKIKVTTTNDAEVPPAIPVSAPPSVPIGSPKLRPKSTQNSKPKNIFDFLKKNFQSKPASAPEADEFEPVSVDNSMFYVPSDAISSSSSCSSPIKDNPPQSNDVNIVITKTITSDAIVEQTDSDLNLTDEINNILDEEISKLVVEDAKL